MPGHSLESEDHPLHATNPESPPAQQHRNSNFAEEGLPQADEENSPPCVPFIVNNTMLGWKLTTRGRKNKLEKALETTHYSNHHPIPIYGFRFSDDEPERKAGTAARREDQHRLHMRAMAAERAVLERRTQATKVKGAAFARDMASRAHARAVWIRKMGDVPDTRQQALRQQSSPEQLRAYHCLLRTRLKGEQRQRRAMRGLPAQRQRSVKAVTTRADL
ncbi:unnamed protein product, partial [Choristocarpus tenellus]